MSHSFALYANGGCNKMEQTKVTRRSVGSVESRKKKVKANTDESTIWIGNEWKRTEYRDATKQNKCKYNAHQKFWLFCHQLNNPKWTLSFLASGKNLCFLLKFGTTNGQNANVCARKGFLVFDTMHAMRFSSDCSICLWRMFAQRNCVHRHSQQKKKIPEPKYRP